MKTKHDFRELLGATQLEMAMLLKINRAQWSMYESGKRKLPTHAQVLLSELLQPYKTAPKTPKNHALLVLQQNNLNTEFTDLIKENDYQIQETEKKIAVLERKRELGIKALQFSDHFNSTSQKKSELQKNALKHIENRAAASITQTGLSEIVKLKIKLQLLQYEAKLLKATLK